MSFGVRKTEAEQSSSKVSQPIKTESLKETLEWYFVASLLCLL